MKRILLGVLLLLVSSVVESAEPGKKTKVLVITGGHGFEEKPFFRMFSEISEITHTHAAHSKGTSDVYDRSDIYDFDVVVLYDMVQNITESQKARFKGLFDHGIGLVVLHHALVSYQNWPEFEGFIGGTYPEPQDKKGAVSDQLGYEHDVDIPVQIANKTHPVTVGLNDFPLHDEIYWGFRTTADAAPLLTTIHPKSGKPLAWTRNQGKSRVIYIQLGHGPLAFDNTNYRKLLAQAIRWASRRAEILVPYVKPCK